MKTDLDILRFKTCLEEFLRVFDVLPCLQIADAEKVFSSQNKEAYGGIEAIS